jgi:hypothetical protein
MAIGNYHPSFLPIAERVHERGMYSPWAYVEYYDLDTPHGHLLQMGDGNSFNELLAGGSIEECAMMLVDAMRTCNDDRHNGHGRVHGLAALDEAYYTAIYQLQTRRYDTDHAHDRWLQMAHKKWGGPVPATVLYPDQAGDWQMMMPDTEANPTVRPIDKSILGDIVPPPQESGASPDEQGVGWRTKLRWPAERRLQALKERKRNA